MWYENNLLVIGVLVGAFLIWRYLEGRVAKAPGEGTARYYITCEQRIEEIEARLEEKITEYEKRLSDQEDHYQVLIKERDRQHSIALQEQSRRIDFLVEQLQEAGVRIRGLELELGQFTRGETPMQPLPAKPLLIVCGMDNAMCDNDRAALRRAGVSFQRLYQASEAVITDELRRRRQDGTLYPWIHVTAHADDTGIHLGPRPLSGKWWREQLSGVSVVFLAACRTSKVADEIAGIVTVIYVNNEDIDSRDASDFTYAFWRRMIEHGDPKRAYRQAIMEVPQVAEFTDIRSG